MGVRVSGSARTPAPGFRIGEAPRTPASMQLRCLGSKLCLRLCIALLAATSGCRSVEALDQPAYVRSRSSGLCGSTLALDAHDDAWSEGGCENGAIVLAPHGRASRSLAATLRRVFETLPATVPASRCEPLNDSIEYRLLEPSGERSWTICVDPLLDTPWRELEAAFHALPGG